MILTGFISFNRSLKDNFYSLKKDSKYITCGKNGYISLQILNLGDDRITNSLIIANILGDSSIDVNNSLLPSKELFTFEDIRNRLKSVVNQSIELSICYNKSKEELIITRGPFGEIPLYYIHIPGDFFAFSTSFKTLSLLDSVKPLLIKNNASIAKFLSVEHLTTGYNSHTYIEPILKVLPGHAITVSPLEIKSAPYLSFNLKQWDHLTTKEEYSEVFLSLFKKSVERTINENKLIGTHLSGGLDSSSISSMVRHLFPDIQLHTFYSNTDTPDTDELHYAIDVVNCIKSQHHIVNYPYDEIDKTILHTSIYGTPLHLIHSPGRQNSMIQAIKNTDCKIVLSGEGGDGIVGYGMEYISILIQDRKWSEVKNEFTRMSSLIQQAIYHPNWLSLTASQREKIYTRESIYKVLAKEFRVLPLNSFVQLFYEICNKLNVSPYFLLHRGTKNLFARKREQDPLLAESFFSINSFANKNTTPDLARILFDGIPIHTQLAYGSVFNASSIAVREDTFALSNFYEMSTRFPFYDKNLLEISMATPPMFKYDNGLRRGHLRLAMKGLLPENVRLRFGKAAFDQFSMQSALRLYNQAQDFLTDNSPIWEYVSKQKFAQIIKRLKQENEMNPVYNHTSLYINKTIFLAVWLDWYNNNIIK